MKVVSGKLDHQNKISNCLITLIPGDSQMADWLNIVEHSLDYWLQLHLQKLHRRIQITINFNKLTI